MKLVGMEYKRQGRKRGGRKRGSEGGDEEEAERCIYLRFDGRVTRGIVFLTHRINPPI